MTLNFLTENEIKKIDSFLKRVKDKINELKKIELIQEDKKEINLNTNKDITRIQNELTIKLSELKEKFAHLKYIEEQDKNELDFLNKKLKKYNEIFKYGKYDKKYIDTEQIIEEDKYEEYSKSNCNATNSINRYNNKTQDEIISYENNEDSDKNNFFSYSLSNRRNQFNQNCKVINLKHNFNVNMNINVNLNLNNNNKDNDFNINLIDNIKSAKNGKINEIFKNIPNFDFNVLNLNMK